MSSLWFIRQLEKIIFALGEDKIISYKAVPDEDMTFMSAYQGYCEITVVEPADDRHQTTVQIKYEKIFSSLSKLEAYVYDGIRVEKEKATNAFDSIVDTFKAKEVFK